MIKTISAIAIVVILFTGCVGTLVANNDVKKSPSTAVQNAKCTTPKENNCTVIKK